MSSGGKGNFEDEIRGIGIGREEAKGHPTPFGILESE